MFDPVFDGAEVDESVELRLWSTESGVTGAMSVRTAVFVVKTAVAVAVVVPAFGEETIAVVVVLPFLIVTFRVEEARTVSKRA